MIKLIVEIEEMAPAKTSITMRSESKDTTDLELTMYGIISECVRLGNNYIATSAKTSEIVSGKPSEALTKEFEEA